MGFTNALFIGTNIIERAGISVITSINIGDIAAPTGWVTRVIGAGIPVVTIDHLNQTVSSGADVVLRAFIPIIAIHCIGCSDASYIAAARVVGTWISIVTGINLTRTSFVGACILDGAYISIIAFRATRGLFDTANTLHTLWNHADFGGGTIVVCVA